MKTLFNIFVITLCILFGAAVVYAGSGKAFVKNDGAAASTQVKGPNFVDNNGDGICDNQGKTGKGGGKGKGNGKGKQYRRGARDGSGPHNTANNRGPNFVDKNGDGICDNRAESGKNK